MSDEWSEGEEIPVVLNIGEIRFPLNLKMNFTLAEFWEAMKNFEQETAALLSQKVLEIVEPIYQALQKMLGKSPRAPTKPHVLFLYSFNQYLQERLVEKTPRSEKEASAFWNLVPRMLYGFPEEALPYISYDLNSCKIRLGPELSKVLAKYSPT
jgi:hypothetical protein